MGRVGEMIPFTMTFKPFNLTQYTWLNFLQAAYIASYRQGRSRRAQAFLEMLESSSSCGALCSGEHSFSWNDNLQENLRC